MLLRNTMKTKGKQSLQDRSRGGRDELNLTEFPIALLSDRPSKKTPTSLRFEAGDKVWEIAGHPDHGLPTAGDGLPSNASRLSETQKTELLSKHLRARLKNVWNAPAAGRPRVRINAIGFFFESPDVGAFLWALAREHEGSFVGMR